MSNITIKFIGKEYSIPEDVLTYIDLLDFTDSVHKYLSSTFVCKLRNEIAKDNIGLLDDEDLATEIEQQVGKFIAKLCDNGIFTRTISDYLKNNKGYQLYSEVNKAALEKMKSLFIQEVDAWQAGYEDAVTRAESHMTGMGFSIWSSSFVNHAIYAAMEASTLNKQGKEAEAQYQKDMNDLRSRLDSQYGGEKSNYINNTYIPNMEAALTVFAYELLDKYVADLIASGKFDSKTLDYVDIGRSNDLLKNLTLSNNKQAILKNAFAACPYNIAVYMQAMKYDLLDYDSFQTAKVFKQDHHVLSFFRESWGEVSFPTKFNINYHCINVWASLTGKSSADLLRGLTEQFATGIVKAYSRVADMMANKATCRKIIGELKEDVVLLGDSICRGKAREYIEPIVSASVWEQLTEKCGHAELLVRIKKQFYGIEELHTKKEVDAYITEQLYSVFETERSSRVELILQKQQEAEARAKEEARIKEEQKRQRTERNKKIGKIALRVSLIMIAVAVVVCIAIAISNKIIIPNGKYNNAVALMENGDYVAAQDILYSLDGYKDSSKLLEQCKTAILDSEYNAAVQLMSEGKYQDAYDFFSGKDYRDSEELAVECKAYIDEDNYNQAVALMEEGNFADALSFLLLLDESYKDCQNRIIECKGGVQYLEYLNAVQLIKEGKYESAYSILISLGDFEESKELLKNFKYVYSKKVNKDENDFEESTYTYSYDIKGNVIEEVLDDGEMVTEYTYDFNNNLIVQISTFDSGKDIGTTYTYENNRLVQSNYVNYYGVVTTTDYFYDESGNLIKEVSVEESENPEITEYEYNTLGQLIVKNDLHYNFKYEYSYDSSGRMVKEVFTDLDDNEQDVTVYEYDEVGNLVRETETSEYGRIDFIEYFYDENNNLIKEVSYWDEEKNGSTEYSGYKLFYTGDISAEVNQETMDNIAAASLLLGREYDSDGSISISQEEYDFISNDVELFGFKGLFDLGGTDAATGIVDILDWTTKDGDFESIISELKTLYGNIFVIKPYSDYPDETYMWKNVDMYEYVLCWMDEDGTITIRWITDIQ